MKLTYNKKNYDYNDRDFITNQFIIGNGHIGYKGTYEEDDKENKVTFNVIGIYDQYKDKRRESLNLFNPLLFRIYENNELLHYSKSDNNKISLKINEGRVYRKTIFKNIILESEKFIHKDKDIIVDKIKITCIRDTNLEIDSGIDCDIYEINGPHYKYISLKNIDKNTFLAKGITNEDKEINIVLGEESNFDFKKEVKIEDNKIINKFKIKLKKGETFELTKKASVFSSLANKKESINALNDSYFDLLRSHIKSFKKEFNRAKVKIHSNDNSSFYLNYSIYELLILGNTNDTSIPARGLSGQVYKGAIFRDSEIFMLPFYLLTNIDQAKSLLKYRINTLNGALNKAKTFGYNGAFYAWESQEDGVERCSLYNVTDSKTGKPIRTYFADKQIHISADVLYGLNAYFEFTKDVEFYVDSLKVFINVAKFYMSYGVLIDNKVHFKDVIGPDEYHERVNDNAFTNYHIYFVLKKFLENIKKYKIIISEKILDGLNIDKIEEFIKSIYLPKANENGIIEQFEGYFDLEDIKYNSFKERISDKKEYLGVKAKNTRVIKQADVCALLALYNDDFSEEIKKANFDFYYPYTEGGSSLSNSMYGLLASFIGYGNIAYELFCKSAHIDLAKNQKMYAGTVYIGGTHPASNGGSYLCLVKGFLGMKIVDDKLVFNPRIPKQIKEIEYQCEFKNKKIKEIFKND